MPGHKEGKLKAKSVALQAVIDASEIIGRWDWDIPADRVQADATVALLFSVDPELAEAGAPLSDFLKGIHADDRERVTRLIERWARQGGAYVTEYRVCSADGVTRWILGRGHYWLDGAGKPQRARGIVIDITQSRAGEDEDVSEVSPITHPVERAGRYLMAAHKALLEAEDPHLQLLAEVLLLEVGRRLARETDAEKRKLMN